MNISEFDYELPADRIAQRPVSRRDRSRLLVLERDSGEIEHRHFFELGCLLSAGDLLVLNDTRVVPARLIGRKATGGRIELFLLERLGPDSWSCLLQARRGAARGTRIEIAPGLSAIVDDRREQDWLVRFECAPDQLTLLLERYGRTPLPPYIKRSESGPNDDDRTRYQTVFSRSPGAVAAPTAGLHFTDALLVDLKRQGIDTAFLTLHVGPGTFKPVRVDQIEEHRMHEEWCDLPAQTAEAIQRTRRAGRRVVAVGTTVARTLESRVTTDGGLRPGADRCDLFIYPGFGFRVVDALITNFHLPRSTLLMLVAAFGGRDPLLAAYACAVDRGYRFYSYGDAMLLRSG
jgi:S-adenosylmethionine:tRNA ribosyltransferase-isomerase